MSSPATRVIALFKASYRDWLTRDEAAAAIGVERNTARAWLEDLVESGMFVERPRSPNARGGVVPAEYTLSRAWGGEADV